jgi:hypothetical protein
MSGLEFDYNDNSTLVTAVRVMNPATGAMEPMDLLKIYNVATVTFLRTGGDGHTIFAERAISPSDNGPSLKDIIVSYYRASKVAVRADEGKRHIISRALNISINSICGEGSELLGEFGCTLCPAGKSRPKTEFDPSLGSSFVQLCKDCLDGFYAPTQGMSNCLACPPNSRTYISGATNINDCKCEAGYYGTVEKGCTKCPAGGVCKGGELHTADDGYLVSPFDPNRYRKCYPAEACRESTCTEGYSGENCGTCLEEGSLYFRRSGECRKCVNPTAELTFFAFILVLSLGTLLILASSYFSSSSSRDRRVLMGVLVFVFQILSLFSSFYPTAWPTRLEGLLNLFQVVNLTIDIFSFECLGKTTQLGKWLVAVNIPLLFLAMLSLYLIGAYVIAKRGPAPARRWLCDLLRWKEGDPGFARQLIGAGATSFLTFLNFGYVYLTVTALSVFDCTREADGTSWMVLDPSTRCFVSAGKFKVYAGIAIPYILFYATGIPAVIWYVIRNAEAKPESSTAQRLAFAFTDEYKPSRKYWLVPMTVWKLVFIVARVFIPQNLRLRGAVAVLLIAINLLMKVRTRFILMNSFLFLSHYTYTCTYVMLCGVFYRVNDSNMQNVLLCPFTGGWKGAGEPVPSRVRSHRHSRSPHHLLPWHRYRERPHGNVMCHLHLRRMK